MGNKVKNIKVKARERIKIQRLKNRIKIIKTINLEMLNKIQTIQTIAHIKVDLSLKME